MKEVLPEHQEVQKIAVLESLKYSFFY